MIVFLSNFFNHHQKPICDELYRLTNGKFHFIEEYAIPKSFLNSGYDNLIDTPYLIKSSSQSALAKQLIIDADIVLFGTISDYSIISQRIRQGGFTIEVNERWLKRGIINLLSPRLWRSQWFYHTLFYNKPVYRLCAGGFVAKDMKFLHSYRNRCFKWAYFTECPDIEIDKLIKERSIFIRPKIMFVARLIPLKRPEIIIELACKLLKSGLDFEINIYGDGPLKDKLEKEIAYHNLSDNVFIRGNLPNPELQKEMRQHSMLLFTSTQREGWGVVVNEAMQNGCPVIATETIGAVPYLIKNGVNGFTFPQNDTSVLFNHVYKLLKDPELRDGLSKNAYLTIKNEWNATIAAERLLKLISILMPISNPKSLRKSPTPFSVGPCSPA